MFLSFISQSSLHVPFSLLIQVVICLYPLPSPSLFLPICLPLSPRLSISLSLPTPCSLSLSLSLAHLPYLFCHVSPLFPSHFIVCPIVKTIKCLLTSPRFKKKLFICHINYSACAKLSTVFISG